MIDALVLRAIPARHHILAGQMLRFGVVGVFGFMVDTTIVYLLRGSVGLYWAGLVSFLVAASANWALHRAWTFRGRGSGPRHRQWAKFLAANLLGFMLNRGAYAALVTFSLLCAKNPVLATAGGAVAGMAVNFVLSRQLVFR
jgi:putative flippase GtrA